MRNLAGSGAGLLRRRSDVDRDAGGRADRGVPSLAGGVGARGRQRMRLYRWLACGGVDRRAGACHSLYRRRDEVAMGITLMVILTAAGTEIAVLSSPSAALIVMALACAGGALFYERTW